MALSRKSTSARWRKLIFQPLETRSLLASLPLGAMPRDTAEFMLGRVAVTPVLLESDGRIDLSTEDWTTAQISQVLANIQAGVDWWVQTLAELDTQHSLEFVLDTSFATSPFRTPYEPISRISNDYVNYVGHFLTSQGYDGSSISLEDAILDFNHDQRIKNDADWAFTIFVVDDTNDFDGMFEVGGDFRRAFAFAGGLFFVSPASRPTSTFTHETGHMFWARDEYAGSGRYNERRGYYDAQNSNAVDGAPPGFVQQPSIMAAGMVLQQAYDHHFSPPPTLAQIGWRDSDNDGIFDLLDVPLELDVAAVYLDPTETLQIRGTARAVPLPNRNSSGLQNDITLNTITRLELRIDQGPWTTIATPMVQIAPLDLQVPVPRGFSTLQLRAVDHRIGLASNIVTIKDSAGPVAGVQPRIQGFVFVDEQKDGDWDAADYLLPGASIIVTPQAPLLHGRVEPDDRPGSVYSPMQPGFQIQSIGNQVTGGVASLVGGAATGTHSFFARTIYSTWDNSWSSGKQELQLTFDQPTSHVSIVAVGKGPASFGRLTGYDAQGNLVARATSTELASGQSQVLRIEDPQRRIASIRAAGTARTSVSLDDLRYGPPLETASATFGTFQFSGLPDGLYNLSITSPSILYTIQQPERQVELRAGEIVEPLIVAAHRSASPWTNPRNPLDVNDNGEVQPLDALLIINDLNRKGNRPLGQNDPAPPFLDVNGDGSVSPIDALRVINHLNRSPTAPPGGGGPVGGSGGSSGGGGSGGGSLPSGEGEFAMPWSDAVDAVMVDAVIGDPVPVNGRPPSPLQWAFGTMPHSGQDDRQSHCLPAQATSVANPENTVSSLAEGFLQHSLIFGPWELPQ